MEEQRIADRSLAEWIMDYPLLQEIIGMKEVFWTNPDYGIKRKETLQKEDIIDAEERLQRFAPYIALAFPETAPMKGIIESPVLFVPAMKEQLEKEYSVHIRGDLLLKCDNRLPISGSVKARGGIYEVLKHAEQLAIKEGLLEYSSDYRVLHQESFRTFFSRYSIAVGSTGNLGLSIGIMGAKLGFHVTVHMSADAKEWKKDLLRSKGVKVLEYESDYSKAVEEGRKQAEINPLCYFIDDENSSDLFLGYAVAASRLKRQLTEEGIRVDASHPLFVYLPCGVGGAPGGITFGLKAAFGEHVHCFFAEPTHAPCFLAGQLTKLYDGISIYDLGIDGVTEADGLAVGRASRFVGKAVGHHISGCYTIEDRRLYSLLRMLADHEGIMLEPSALAGFYGPVRLFKQPSSTYLQESRSMPGATHLIWATGGDMVPEAVMADYYRKGTTVC